MYTPECQQALAPILHKTDLSTHTKRFVIAAGFWITALVVAVVATWIIQVAVVANEKVPENVRLNNKDLAQIQTMSDASSFVAIGIGSGASPTATVAVQAAPTSTSP